MVRSRWILLATEFAKPVDNAEFRMTNVEGIPKSEAPMERQQALSRHFDFRDSDFFRHWSLVIRHSVCCSLSPGERVRVRGNDGLTATECRITKGVLSK